MSAPAFETRAADYIGQSFLAIKAKKAINVFLKGEALSESEKEVLFKAHKFLKEIASGASLVATGESKGFKPMESMAALNYAMDPIESLRDLLGDRDIATFFNEMADSVELGAKGSLDALPAKGEMLQFAVSFFEALYKSLSKSLDRNNHPLGGSAERNYALAYA